MSIYHKIFKDKYINKKCKLLIIKDKKTLEKFIEIIKKFFKLKKKICSFDLEFNDNKMSLMQIGLYFYDSLKIILLNPNKTIETKSYIKQIFIDKNIIKIGHGTDSLDIPNIYKFLNNDEDMKSFLYSIYDTRYLCEYINTFSNDTKCNIYHCLKIFNVIDNEQLNFLYNVEKKVGKFWLHKINIFNLSEDLIIYSMYDVIYLKDLLKNIKSNIQKQKLSYQLSLEIIRLKLLLKVGLIEIPSVIIYNGISYNNIQLKKHFSIVLTSIETDNLSYKTILNNSLLNKQILLILIIVFYYYIYQTKKLSELKNIENILNNLNKILKPFPYIIKFIINFYKSLKY